MDLVAQLRASLLANSLPAPSTAFLTALVSSRSPPPPLPSLLATAKARLLACDLTSHDVSGNSSANGNNNGSGNGQPAILDHLLLTALPSNASDASVTSIRLPRDVHVQVLDVENLSLSRWEQIEELEEVARGERTRGRQVIRVTADADADNGTSSSSSSSAGTQQQRDPATASGGSNAHQRAGANATHRLVLQDSRGTRIYAVELRRIDRIGIGKTNVGEKVLLRAGTVVARGTVLLAPETCLFLGGRIEAWHESWVQGRLQRLKDAVGADRPS